MLGSHVHAPQPSSSNPVVNDASPNHHAPHFLNDTPAGKQSPKSDQYVPDLSSSLAEIRVSVEDMPDQSSSSHRQSGSPALKPSGKGYSKMT